MFTGPGHPALDDGTLGRDELHNAPTHRHRSAAHHPRAAWTRHGGPDTPPPTTGPPSVNSYRTSYGTCNSPQRCTAMRPRRKALALFRRLYGLTQMFVAYQPAQDLLSRLADRALLGRAGGGGPLALTCAVWFLAQPRTATPGTSTRPGT